MRVLVLASAGGDAHRRALGALVAAASTRHDVRVLAPEAEAELLRPFGVPVDSWNPAGLFRALRSVGALRRAAEHHAPDLIHAVGWSAAAVALGARPPAEAGRALITLLEPLGEGEMPKQFVEKRLPELLRRAAFATAASPALARELTERFGLAAERLQVIPVIDRTVALYARLSLPHTANGPGISQG